MKRRTRRADRAAPALMGLERDPGGDDPVDLAGRVGQRRNRFDDAGGLARSGIARLGLGARRRAAGERCDLLRTQRRTGALGLVTAAVHHPSAETEDDQLGEPGFVLVLFCDRVETSRRLGRQPDRHLAPGESRKLHSHADEELRSRRGAMASVRLSAVSGASGHQHRDEHAPQQHRDRAHGQEGPPTRGDRSHEPRQDRRNPEHLPPVIALRCGRPNFRERSRR